MSLGTPQFSWSWLVQPFVIKVVYKRSSKTSEGKYKRGEPTVVDGSNTVQWASVSQANQNQSKSHFPPLCFSHNPPLVACPATAINISRLAMCHDVHWVWWAQLCRLVSSPPQTAASPTTQPGFKALLQWPVAVSRASSVASANIPSALQAPQSRRHYTHNQEAANHRLQAEWRRASGFYRAIWWRESLIRLYVLPQGAGIHLRCYWGPRPSSRFLWVKKKKKKMEFAATVRPWNKTPAMLLQQGKK